ncbi:f-box pof7 [Fusarium mundagurra]|uniref:F-box pof7 n=1 Tax=Fusarium mundagurra TaxID=1567541 RepID=A0A8H5XUL2_9HYPO|nr:f-box pof7 [Fusarium mundagurra]
MTAFPEGMPFFLNLSNEILLTVFGLCKTTERKQRNDTISQLRLTCQRFSLLCSDYAVRSCGTLDFSRPESVRLFRQVLDNPRIAHGVREVNVRLHFYHPWIAASLDNFTTAALSEWGQRTQMFDDMIDINSGGQIAFECLIKRFANDIQMHNESTEPSITRNEGGQTNWPNGILQRAYESYKESYDSQVLLHGDSAFATGIAEILTRLPNIRHVMLHDGVLENNYDLGRKFDAVDERDISAQADVLIQVLSRPMLWEEARWIQPNEFIWPGVPTRLLVDIPLALGAQDSLFIDRLSIHVSTAPDYTTLQLSRDDQHRLSDAIRQLDPIQFSFQPRCRSGCGPWIRNEEDNGTVRTASEMEVINEYLGAVFNAECITHADINLGEFWYSLGLKSMLDAPTSVGIGFTWPIGSDLHSINLTEITITTTELGALVAALVVGSEISLFLVHIRVGLWRDALRILRDELRDPRSVSIRHPIGGEIQNLAGDQVESIFNSQYTDEGTKAECYAMGRMLDNPLDTNI